MAREGGFLEGGGFGGGCVLRRRSARTRFLRRRSAHTRHFADWDGFAGEAGFVDAQGERIQHFGIGGDTGAALDEDDITDDEFVAGQLADFAIAPDDDGRFVVHLAQQVEFAAGAVFVGEAESGGQEDGDEDTQALQQVALDGADGQGDDGGQAEDADDGVVEFLEVETPPGGARGWGDAVGAVFGAAGHDFGGGQAGGVALLHIRMIIGAGKSVTPNCWGGYSLIGIALIAHLCYVM